MKKRAEKYGFKTVTEFIISSAEDFFVIYLDLSHFREVAKEINYIGQDINNIIHHIFAIGVYSDHDLKELQRLLNEVYKKIDKEYDYLLTASRKYRESNVSLKNNERLIKELKKKGIEVPKKLVRDEIYEQIRNDISYICNLIDDSPEQEDMISEYVYAYFLTLMKKL
ncbi:MAG TPA: hypothetical protein VK105_13600 [Virgibacillus sp.]|nr:hypothetical protein [Virgibacillus sp.]HLR68142.1 hypothetical protein [Virgibacillus sp.]